MIENKNKWNLVGDTFAGDACATHGKESKNLEWLRDMSSSTTFHVDQGLFQPVLSPKQQSYGWILESEAIIPEVYANAPRVLDKFEYIFTHSEALLKLDSRFKLAPVGTHWIQEPQMFEKTKNVSMVSSNKAMCLGHLYRLSWVEKFKEKVDFFGRGFNPIDRKEEALCDYRFSVAIENGAFPNYFTEKIGDCFATGTIPVYYGCPNIGDYFNTDGIIILDHSLKIEDLTEELYLSKLDAVKENLELVKKYEIPEDYIYETYFNNE
tara:strand:- start:7870 stop:8667 length:798 start_codon:yes stop_codon:yes gene_type:complete